MSRFYYIDYSYSYLFCLQVQDLEARKDTVEQVERELVQTRSQLDQARSELDQTRSQLVQTRSQLVQTRSQLDQVVQDLESSKGVREHLEEELNKQVSP
jgi:septal ring factor EnvC (AmiA/AmiB activator)